MPTEDASPRPRRWPGGDAPAAGTPVELSGRFEVERIRRDFPALAQLVNGQRLVYLDSASTAQKPRAVIDALLGYYERDCANIHRGVHTLSQRATTAYEAVREKVAAFLGARTPSEIVFTRGTTEALNFLAYTLGKLHLHEGDEVLISGLEHHSNLVPWQLVCKERGARLRVIPLDAHGEPRLEALDSDQLLGPRTRIVAISHAGNALGTLLPVAEIAARARAVGALVVVDGAPAVPHLPVSVEALGCDFYCFSGHKLFGPTGVGVLWGRKEQLLALSPWQGGGDMILSVAFAHTEYQEPPYRFEAGTPPIAEVIGLGAAIEYLGAIGWPAIERHEEQLYAHGRKVLSRVPGLRLLGGDSDGPRVPVLSFAVAAIHPHDVGTVLDQQGIAVRTGHHCAEPLMRHLGVPGTVRASLAFYNTTDELDALAEGLYAVVRMFG